MLSDDAWSSPIEGLRDTGAPSSGATVPANGQGFRSLFLALSLCLSLSLSVRASLQEYVVAHGRHRGNKSWWHMDVIGVTNQSVTVRESLQEYVIKYRRQMIQCM